MSARLERVLRAYAPLRLRGTLTEGQWVHVPRETRPPDTKPRRMHLFALVALLLPRRGRGGTGR